MYIFCLQEYFIGYSEHYTMLPVDAISSYKTITKVRLNLLVFISEVSKTKQNFFLDMYLYARCLFFHFVMYILCIKAFKKLQRMTLLQILLGMCFKLTKDYEYMMC